MKRVMVATEDLCLSSELSRSRGSKPFEERLKASIEQIGLIEPIKVAMPPKGKYLIVDGMMRFRAIQAIRRDSPELFSTVAAYVVDFNQRYEVRYQTDIYQDLLPSQLANLVEHLHKSENILKSEIAKYIGVSPTTVRNYTGLYRMLERGGLFAKLVGLMDLGIIPASNPYAWLRLSDEGIRFVLEMRFSEGIEPYEWIESQVANVRLKNLPTYPIKSIEAATSGLKPDCYREDEDVRDLKRNLGLRRAASKESAKVKNTTGARRRLQRIATESPEPVIRTAAIALSGYLK